MSLQLNKAEQDIVNQKSKIKVIMFKTHNPRGSQAEVSLENDSAIIFTRKTPVIMSPLEFDLFGQLCVIHLFFPSRVITRWSSFLSVLAYISDAS